MIIPVNQSTTELLFVFILKENRGETMMLRGETTKGENRGEKTTGEMGLHTPLSFFKMWLVVLTE